MSFTTSSLLPSTYTPTSVASGVRQSAPVNLDIPYDVKWLKGKVILVTGGASGFGAGFVKSWAAGGATVIIGDINVALGDKVARETRSETGNPNVHYVHCNVTDWNSQVNYFKEAVKLSPHGGIDIVVPNAGIGAIDEFEQPVGLDAAEPPKPNFKTLDVNLVGVLYTVHLALFYLPRNPGAKDCTTSVNPSNSPRDRCILLVGSMASLGPIPTQVQYGVSKHGVLGLFRNLRATSFVHGVRTNCIFPYFIDTPIVTTAARFILAGGATGKPEDVVDAATRLVADSRILGRSLCIGPKLQARETEAGEIQLVEKPVQGEPQRAVWEAYGEDFEDVELFGKNMIRLLNQVSTVRGWAAYLSDTANAIAYGLGFGGAPKR